MQVRLILALLVLAQLADAATFTVGMALHGIHLESNGVAVLAYGAGGLAGVLLLKGGAILLVLGTLVVTAERFPRLLKWGGATASGVGLLGVFANTTSLLLLA